MAKTQTKAAQKADTTAAAPAAAQVAQPQQGQETQAPAAPAPEVVKESAQADAAVQQQGQLTEEEAAGTAQAPEASQDQAQDQPQESGAPARAATHIRVTALADRFYRARRAFGREPVVILLTDLTDDDLLAIEREPMLAVEYVALSDEG